MNRRLTLALVLVSCAAVFAWAGGPGGNGGGGNGGGGNGGGGGGGQALTPAEEDGLVFMREEEKLARDVYLYFDDLYDLPIFGNIAGSEQRHMDAILTLLDRYELEDPAAGNAQGEFTDPALQALYDQLIVEGSASLEDALGVGVFIEETDIADLEARLPDIVHSDIRRVYENLLRGSQNHLAAFQSQLDGGAAAGGLAVQRGFGRQRGVGRGLAGWARGRCHGQCGAGCRCRGSNGQCPLAYTRIEGLLDSIDPVTQQFVVGDVVVQVTDTTIIRQQGQTIAFADLTVGQTVAVCGVMDGDALVANRVTVKYCGN
jgi:hypothetical protein